MILTTVLDSTIYLERIQFSSSFSSGFWAYRSFPFCISQYPICKYFIILSSSVTYSFVVQIVGTCRSDPSDNVGTTTGMHFNHLLNQFFSGSAFATWRTAHIANYVRQLLTGENSPCGVDIFPTYFQT